MLEVKQKFHSFIYYLELFINSNGLIYNQK